jgi:hypothetical protein
MDKTLAVYASQYYTSIISSVIAVICVFVGIRRRKIHPSLGLFPFYAAGYFFLDPLDLLLMAFKIRKLFYLLIFQNFDNLFTYFELVVYFKFFKPNLNRIQKKTFLLLLISFTIFFILATIKGNLNGPFRQSTKSMIYTIQSVILLIPCVFYYSNLFTNKPASDLKNDPRFWVVTGLFCMLFGMLPFSICEKYLLHNDYSTWVILSGIDNLLYGLNFIMIIRAYLCKAKAL